MKIKHINKLAFLLTILSGNDKPYKYNDRQIILKDRDLEPKKTIDKIIA